jgi:hypothetical protein
MKNIGVKHISQLNEIKQSKFLKKSKIDYKNLSKYSEYVLPNFTLDEYRKNLLNNQSWICVKCRERIHSRTTIFYTVIFLD